MIIAKEYIRRKFSRASGTYEQKAAVQSQMARQLISYLEKKEYDSVLEVGCGTGYLSSLLIQNFRINKLILNDISESMLSYCRAKFSCITSVDYLCADAEEIHSAQKFSLIISNACVQWFDDLKKTLSDYLSFLEPEGCILFSSFGNDNLKELRELNGLGLNYLDDTAMKNLLSSLDGDFEFSEQYERVYYSSAMELLHSLKKTGVGGFSREVWSRGRLNQFISEYESRFSDDKGVYLTWHIYYVMIHRKNPGKH